MTPGVFNLILWKGATFGPIEITCKNSNGDIVNLTGWTALAQVRLAPGKHTVLDLLPSVPVGTDGKVTFGFTDEETASMPHGDYVWDLMLQPPDGKILGPILAGTFAIKSSVTRV